ncbi:MAG: alpha/beta hydrolase [Blastocatellia bacterium]
MKAPLASRGGPRPGRWKRVLKRVILALLILFVVLVYCVFPLWLSSVVTNARTRPADRQLTETPADYKAEFRDVEFHTSDGVRISAWLMPSRGRRTTIIYSHGLFRSRRELLERAADLWQLGYGALLYDARNHGDSGPARVSFGYNERLDAEAAVRFLREDLRSGDRVVLFGISMGAATALLAAAETPEVAAIISDSSFLSFKDTTDHHVRLFLHLPAFPLSNEMRYLMEWRAGFDGSRLDALDAVKRIGPRPILFIAAAHDKRMPPDLAQRLYEASASPRRDLLVVDGPGSEIHGHAYQADRKLYVTRAAQFLEAALENQD